MSLVSSNNIAALLVNPIIKSLPPHLLTFVVPQNYEAYTPVNHAVWRYVMRQNLQNLSKIAHDSYLDGLKKTGISIEKIPNLLEMNTILAKIGWAAVTVDGFIPPSAFMEFQAYKVLVIAADIRQINHIEYTPAPDILHEAAGHAPIIANKEYSDYLQLFGEIGSKALSSAKDYELYEAIRHLSILKEYPETPIEDVQKAEQEIESIMGNMGELSEMSQIRRLHWWTVEYGLIGELENPKIYGAGLLSSIGESVTCLLPEVNKIPYSLEAATVDFDITKTQPQLFVTPSFEHLTKVLNEFADTMALRKGGKYGIEKAIATKNTATVQLDNGLQISGTFAEIITNDKGEVIYIKTNSPTSIALDNKELGGHTTSYHEHGYSTPLGKIKNLNTESKSSIFNLAYKQNGLEFENGIVIEGTPVDCLVVGEEELIITFEDCTISYNGKILFQPEWGDFDLAVGKEITAVFSGAADKVAFGNAMQPSKHKTLKITYDDKDKQLHSLYQLIRDVRDQKKVNISLEEIFGIVKTDFPEDWLATLEIAEYSASDSAYKALQQEASDYLQQLSQTNPTIQKLILDGLKLISV